MMETLVVCDVWMSLECCIFSEIIVKSMLKLVHFLTAEFFFRHKRVAFLDTDVGQTEFTPSGLLSLTVVDKITPGTYACFFRFRSWRSISHSDVKLLLCCLE